MTDHFDAVIVALRAEGRRIEDAIGVLEGLRGSETPMPSPSMARAVTTPQAPRKPEALEQARKMYEAGAPFAKIARATDVSENTVRNWARVNSWTRPPVPPAPPPPREHAPSLVMIPAEQSARNTLLQARHTVEQIAVGQWRVNGNEVTREEFIQLGYATRTSTT